MSLMHTDLGQGPVVVLLHGFPLNRSMWAGQLTTLGKICRVIVPDLRGYGENPPLDPVPEPYADGPAALTVEDLAGDVLALLDDLGVSEPVVVGGLSMGGYVAMALASIAPERVRALMLFDTRAEGDTPEAAQRRESQAKAVLETGSAQSLVTAMLPMLLCPSTLKEQPDLTRIVQQMMEAARPTTVAATLRGLARRPDRSAMLRELARPTLVVVGQEDAITPPSVAQTLAQLIPGSNLIFIASAGHLAPLEQPEAVNTAILEFLARVVHIN